MSNKSKIMIVCVFVLAAVCSLIIAGNRMNTNAVAEARHARRATISHRNAANSLVRMQIMTPDETVRFQDITTSVLQTHEISDADLDWILMVLNQPESKPGNSTEMHYIVLGTLVYVNKTTPQQQSKIFGAMLPLLSGNTFDKKSADEVSDKVSADQTLAAFKVTEAIPYIQVQLRDPSPYVKAEAKRALAKIAS